MNTPATDSPVDRLLPQCPNCHAFMWSNDDRKHRNRLCKIIQNSSSVQVLWDSIIDDDGKVDNGFIKDGSMVAEVTDVTLRDKEIDQIPEHLRDSLLLMNEIGMKALDLSDGDAVKVRSLSYTNKESIWSLICWSCPTIKRPCHVSFPTFDDHMPSEGDTILVERITGVENAQSIFLRAVKSDSLEADIIVDMKKKLNGRKVYNGMRVKLADDEEFILNINNKADISAALSTMTINGDGKLDGWPIFYSVGTETRLQFPPASSVTFADVAGIDEQIEQMKDFLVTTVERKTLVRKMKGSPIRGVLIHGFTGTGKTLAVNAFINEYSHLLFCVHIDAARLISKNAEATDKKISSIIDLCIEQSPSVIFVDRLEVIASSKKSQTDIEKKLISCLLSQFDKISSLDYAKDVFLVGVTNQSDVIDSVLKGPSRFDVEIEFPIPLAKHRRSIFSVLMGKVHHCVPRDVMINLSEGAFSFTGADLKSVVSRATISAIKGDRDIITEEDIRSAFKSVRPSAMREILLEVPSVKWNEIGGVSSLRVKLEQMVLWPFKHPEYFETVGIPPRKGILMYGPPGCSKTMIGKALATESNLNFISIKGPELFNKYVGESEKAVRDIFKRAKQASPSILFFDEIDALAPERSSSSSSSSNNNVSDRVLAQLLTEMDGIEKLGEVIIVAATNRPDMIDPALLRPGRLDSVIYVPLPDATARKEIFLIRTQQMPLDADVNIDSLVRYTEGYSGAEVTAVCTEAGLLAMTDSLSSGVKVPDIRVMQSHFETALKSIPPRTTKETIVFFERYQHNQGK